MTTKYLNALADMDWPAACQTRSREERRSFVRRAGSCERAFELIGPSKNVARLFRRSRARAAEIEIRGDGARVPVFFPPGQVPPPVIDVLAQRESGRWFLVSVPAAKQKAFLRGE